HEVADAEADLGVGGVDGPGTRDVPGDGGGGLDCGHDVLLGVAGLLVSSTVEYGITNYLNRQLFPRWIEFEAHGGRCALARYRRTPDLARLDHEHPAALGGDGARPPARLGPLVRPLRDPGDALGDPRLAAPHERAGRRDPVVAEPAVARGEPARGAGLGAARGVPVRPARSAGRAHRRGLRRARSCRADARRERAPPPLRPPVPRAAGQPPGDP